MTRPRYANIGEPVKITIPKIFIRCGYSLDHSSIYMKYHEEIAERVKDAWEALARTKIPDEENSEFSVVLVAPIPDIPSYIQSRLEQAVASFIIRREHWGGNQRCVFEEEMGALAGQVVTVTGKRFVKTGTYHRGRYSGEEGWDPPYLEDEESHCIYKFDFGPSKLQILASNCVRNVNI